MSDIGRPPLVETQIIPVVARTDPRFDRRDQWTDDRTGRFVVVGLVLALAFFFVAAGVWWAGGGRQASNDALAADAPEIAPVTVPATVVDDGNAASDVSSLALSPAPMPAQGLALTQTAQAAPSPPSPTQPAPPVTEAPAPESTAESTTTTLPTTTTTIAPTTTVAVVVVTSIPATTAAASTTTTTTTTPSTTSTTAPATSAPATTAPAPANGTLLDVVSDTPELSRVRELIELSGFAPELDAARELTFLAPSNAAVDAWSATPEGQAAIADPDAVYNLLLRHLVPEALVEMEIFTHTTLPTVSGATLVVSQESRTVDGADLLVVDVGAANGYLHVVSDVLSGA